MKNLIKKAEIRILIGNIGSGKSTLAKKLAKEGHCILNKDMLRFMLGGGNYIEDKNIEKEIYDIFFKSLHILLSKGYSIVIDGPNITKKERFSFIVSAQLYNYNKIGIILPKINKEESINRRLKNNHGNTPKYIWEANWVLNDSQYQEPTKEEGFNEVIKL